MTLICKPKPAAKRVLSTVETRDAQKAVLDSMGDFLFSNEGQETRERCMERFETVSALRNHLDGSMKQVQNKLASCWMWRTLSYARKCFAFYFAIACLVCAKLK